MLLDQSAPHLLAYTPETAIAKKYQAMVALDQANSGMKDFHDIWTLAHNLDFGGEKLAEAIRTTFEQRKTELPQSVPTAFTSSFYDDRTKQTQWQAFLRKGLGTSETPTLTVVANAIHYFLMPVTEALKRGESFTRQWKQGGPWQ